MKKIAIVAGTAALILSLAAPALGVCYGGGCYRSRGSDIEVKNENEGISVNVGMEVEAETGDNEIETKGMIAKGGGSIVTGNAFASGYVGVENTNTVKVSCCWNSRNRDVEVKNENERISVKVGMEVEAETGDNEIETKGKFACGGGSVRTGHADAWGDVVVVNSNITRLGRR